MSIATMHKATAYDAYTFYTLQNLGATPVFFSLSSAPDVEGDERVDTVQKNCDRIKL